MNTRYWLSFLFFMFFSTLVVIAAYQGEFIAAIGAACLMCWAHEDMNCYRQ